MSQITSQIEKMLKDDALQHSLAKESLAAMLDEIQTLSKMNSKLMRELETALDLNKSLGRERDDLTTSLRMAQEDLARWKERENKLIARERKASHTEIENRYAQKYGTQLENTLALLVRNTEYKKTVLGQQPCVVKDPYSTDGERVDLVNTTTDTTEEAK